jgi:CarD family transcriptional regulator
MFKVGDVAVYPAHGVAVVESIEDREISGLCQCFYILRLLENDMTIMVPENNAHNVGLREVIPRKEVHQVYKILKKRGAPRSNKT